MWLEVSMAIREQEPGTSAPLTGQALPYLDAAERVTGSVPYTLNLELPGMLYVKLLRSPHAHARIVSLDARAAERLPGVACVLTGARLRGMPLSPTYGGVNQGKTIREVGKVRCAADEWLAIEEVRYAGDVVAAVAAVDEDTAAEALDLIEVEYEELPAVFDAEEALRPGTALLHETLPPRRATFADIIVNREAGSNL